MPIFGECFYILTENPKENGNIIPIALGLNAFQIYQSYYSSSSLYNEYPVLLNQIYAYAHVLLGLSLVIIFKAFLTNIYII